MKILQINKFFHFRGGADKYFFDIINLLEEKGHEVITFSTKNKENKKSTYENYFINGLSEKDIPDANLFDKLNVFLNAIYPFSGQKRLQKLINDHKPQLAHIHNIFYQISPIILRVLKNNNIPIVMSLLDTQILCGAATFTLNDKPCFKCKDSELNLLKNKCYKHDLTASLMAYLSRKTNNAFNIWSYVDLFITASNNFKNIMVEWGFDENKIEVIPYFDNYLDLDIKGNDVGKYVLFVGRISFEKGIDTLLKAFDEINYPLIIIGDGPQIEWAKDYVRDHKLRNVSFMGFVSSSEELTKFIIGSRFVVIPSNWYELYPLIALDAFCFNKPVIASNTGGLNEIIDNYTNGFLFERFNSKSLTEKLKLLIEDNNLCMQLGKNAKIKASNNYSKEVYYSKLLKSYRKLI